MNNFWTKLPKPFLALAPMAGVTDLAFRTMCKRFGADVIYTEFASANALARNSQKTHDMLSFSPGEKPVVCQIFGNDPSVLRLAARQVERLGFSGIDINFGCPAYKVTRHGGGVNLMRNPELCAELVAAVCSATTLPVSIKVRASINLNQKKITALDLVKKIKSLPISAIMVHGRSYEKPFDGEPDLEMISEVKKLFTGIVIANGGIYSPVLAKEMVEATHADGLGIARGALGRPWIFRQIREYLASGTYHEPTWDEKKQYIMEHVKLALEAKGPYGIIEMRKHLAWYVKGLPRAKKIREELVKVKTLEEVQRIIMTMPEQE
ncbi:MAG: tRNA-dihydrouridine synthase [Patescibacteria group bacterium]